MSIKKKDREMLWEKTKGPLASWGPINGLLSKRIGNNYFKREIEC